MKTLLPNKIMFWELGLQYTFLRGGGAQFNRKSMGKDALLSRGAVDQPLTELLYSQTVWTTQGLPTQALDIILGESM